MRSYYWLPAVLALLLLCLSNPIPAIFADSPTPTPKPRTVSAPGTLPYKVSLPIIISGNGSAQTSTLKKGVPLTYDDCPSVTAMGATWEYDWRIDPPECQGIENIPMIWGRDNVSWTLGGNSNWIMGFNEPDSPSQSNISPSDAAILWRQVEQKYPSRKLLSPATTGSISGLGWLQSFYNAYASTYHTAPRLDGLAVHCYKWSANECISLVQSFMDQATTWGVSEVWVTEFSFATTSPSCEPEARQYQQTFISWMVTQPKITRFAWFASKIQGTEWWVITCYDGSKCFNNPLVDWNTGQPTSFGSVYQPYH